MISANLQLAISQWQFIKVDTPSRPRHPRSQQIRNPLKGNKYSILYPTWLTTFPSLSDV